MIQRTTSDDIEIVRLSHGKASALDLELCTAIEETFRSLAGSSIRAVILTGSGSIFSAGVDLFRMLDEDAGYTEPFLDRLDGMLHAVFDFPKPLVTAVNGHAIAGGCLLGISGDVRLMAEGKGRIGVPELLVGVPFPPFALEMVRFAAPSEGALQRLVYGGLTLLPEEALAIDLIDRVVEPGELEPTALQEAQRLSEIRSEVFATTKAQLRAETGRRAGAWADEPRRRTIAFWSSKETRDAIRSYLDRTVRK